MPSEDKLSPFFKSVNRLYDTIEHSYRFALLRVHQLPESPDKHRLSDELYHALDPVVADEQLKRLAAVTDKLNDLEAKEGTS